MSDLRARIVAWDQRIIRGTHRLRWRPLTGLMKVATYSATGPVWILAVGALLALHFAGRGAPLGDDFLRAMLAALGGWLVGNLLRLLVGRPRPFRGMADHEALVWPPPGASMPSTHAASSIGLATALLSSGHPAAPLVLVWALLTSASRLYLGVHYLTDILVGCALGVIFGLIGFPWP